jgi:hypothetical protein
MEVKQNVFFKPENDTVSGANFHRKYITSDNHITKFKQNNHPICEATI